MPGDKKKEIAKKPLNIKMLMMISSIFAYLCLHFQSKKYKAMSPAMIT